MRRRRLDSAAQEKEDKIRSGADVKKILGAISEVQEAGAGGLNFLFFKVFLFFCLFLGFFSCFFPGLFRVVCVATGLVFVGFQVFLVVSLGFHVFFLFHVAFVEFLVCFVCSRRCQHCRVLSFVGF